MKLDMGKCVRERPVLQDSIKEQQPNVKPEMQKEQLSLQEDQTSTSQWNIPLSSETDLEVLMSQLTLARDADHAAAGPRVSALCRLVRVALSRATRQELGELAKTATQKSQPEFVRHLGRLLGANSQKEDKLDVDIVKQTAGCRTTPSSEPGEVQTHDERRAKPKRKGLVEELKEDNDLCPRSPMRPQHHRPNSFPYQNTSRNHHSGGIMSAVAYSDAIAPTPHYHNHVSFPSLGSVASRPPLIVESSDVPFDTTFNDLDSMLNLSEGDLEILMSLAVDLCPKIPTEDDNMFPESISEINSTQPGNSVPDHRVPSDVVDDLFPPSLEAWPGSGYHHYHYDSGCSSLSPGSLPSPGPANHLPSSPDSFRVVPDDTAPNMSPPGQFFEDNPPLTSNYDSGVYAKVADNYCVDRSPGSSGYSSTSTPSPTDYPSAAENSLEDFDLKVQNASNHNLYSFDGDFDSDYLFENVFESAPPIDCSPSNFYGETNVYAPQSTVANVSNVLAAENVPRPIAEFESVNAEQPTFADLTNASVDFPASYAVGGATYAESTPSTVNTANLTLAMPALQAKLVSLSVSNLKRLEPKVEHFLRAETGRERILKLMDKKKKAEAWVNISLKINEVAKQDNDGDTQLMILCANAAGSAQGYALEYTYAMVEMLKSVPGALSAVNNQRQSALYLAAIHSDYSSRAIVVRYIAETLIELGEDIARTTEGGDSMLHELCHQGDQRYDVLVELLSLKNQAGQPYFDVNQYNAKGLTPLHVAVKSHGVNNIASLMTVQLLIAERADIMLPEKAHSHTALHLAVLESCAPRLVEALLRGHQGGRVCNMLNLRRDSSLHCAASRNDLLVAQQMKVIQLLLEHGAVKSLNANGKFPIALVAEERRQEIRRVYETRKSNQANVGAM